MMHVTCTHCGQTFDMGATIHVCPRWPTYTPPTINLEQRLAWLEARVAALESQHKRSEP